MDPPNGDGPDGSSIRPVSSLRARFENMGNSKPTDVPAPPTSSSRSISPAPKPDRLRDFRPAQEAPSNTSSPVVPSRPQPRPKSFIGTVSIHQDANAPPTVPHPSTRPVIAPKPQPTQQHAPQPPVTPAVMVQPPQSPPKGRIGGVPANEQSPFLNPDPVAAPSTPGSSGRQFKIPSRPHTPSASVDLPRSPRSGGSQPPSPPPPRRSSEARREPPPPPAPRKSEKPLIPAPKPTSATEGHTTGFVRKPDISQENSPFNSPPSSFDSPPKLPARPRPQPQGDMPPPPRPRSVVIGFDPPPVHPIHRSSSVVRREPEAPAHTVQRSASVAVRREPDANGMIRGHIGYANEPSPALPSRPSGSEAPPRPLALNTNANAMKPPPRPPRPGIPSTTQVDSPQAPVPPKRVVSTPTTQQSQSQLAPARTHGRSMTIDRTSDRAPAEFRIPTTAVTSATTVAGASKPIQSTPVPAKIASATSATSAAAVTGAARPIQSTPVATQMASKVVETLDHITAYPEASNINRRPPFIKQGTHEIATKYDARTFDICGEYVCASGHMTRVWSLLDGELVMSLQHTEGIKATTVAFKPAADPREEGKRLWIGTNNGELMEVEVATHMITPGKPNVHGRFEVTRIYRHFNEMWTLDEAGTLLVWGPDNNSVSNVTAGPSQSYKIPKGHTFSMVIGDELWHATGKEIRVFAPSADGRTQFQVLVRPLVVENAGEVTAGTLVRSDPDKVMFSHVDGKITVYSISTYTCIQAINLSTWKINALANSGHHIWAAYNTGKICVYEIDETPWTLKKEWQAHDNGIVKMVADPSSSYFLDRLQVVTLGGDNKIKAWDGLLEDDWLDESMKSKDTQYCDFDEIKALFFTWNAGASTPSSLRYSGSDGTFFQDLIQSSSSPDILVFGFQELVDLEDKKLTAKSFLKKNKKKEGSDQERMSHQYRDWRDFLMKTLDDYMPAGHLYHLLHTAPMVGLFTCVFVKSSLRDRIRNLHGAEVKRGMGGLHGNKGGVAVRFKIDDSSVCLLNCHLAAGQSQANQRHKDIEAILESPLFPTERDPAVRVDSYVGGGDGSLIVDHELCILNGDMNYRIDTMSRDTVVTAVKQNNLAKLLERDQLLVARRRNPAFKLRAFDEMPITFAPTYKYDVGTDTYDTSEKRRSPAWCDRILHKGRGRIEQYDYRRHEVRVSDHRPVTATFNLWVKKVDHKRRSIAWVESEQGYESVREEETRIEKLLYLMNTCGFDEQTSQRLVQERSGR